jgi:predicted dehydrogenase
MTTIAQLGCGYWGPNLLRNFSGQPDCLVKWVADQNPERRAFVEQHYPRTKAVAEWQPVIADPEVEAIVIATPAATHFMLVKASLEAGKHVLVEKPLAMSTCEADELASLAARAGRTLMVGHTFLYNAAVRYMKQLLDNGELGQMYYIYSQRLNLGQLRSDVNAWWNLAPHDISILLYLMDGALPATISTEGMDYIQPGVEDVVFAVLTWSNRLTAHVHVSWLDPGKVRRMTLVGSRKMVVYDDVSDDKIAVLDKGFDRVPRAGQNMDYDHFDNYQLFHRAGDVLLPRIRFQEPLQMEAAHFLECIRTGQTPLTGAQHGRDVVAILEAGQLALKRGTTVHVPVLQDAS